MRIVLDTSSFVAAIRSSQGAANEVIRRILMGDMVMLMDYKIGLEYWDVALRADHVTESDLTAEEIDGLIRRLERVAEAVEVTVQIRPLSTDPNDDMILDLAISGKADGVVTNNLKHFKEAGRRFGFDVVTPKELLDWMRKGSDAS